MTTAMQSLLIAGFAGATPWKLACRLASSANLTRSGEQTINAVAALAGDRVLLTAQTAGKDNAIWVVSAGAWTRAEDADTSDEMQLGTYVRVLEGSNAGNWYLSSPSVAPIVVGSTSLTFTRDVDTPHSGTAPIVVTTGGSVPVISINPATGSTAGSFSASDKTKLDAATASATATTVALRDASGGCAFDDLTAVTLVASSSIKGPTQVSAIKTATYTAAIDEIVRVNPSGGAFDVDLPTAVGNAGRAVTVKNVTSSTTAVTVDPDGSETVDTAASYSLAVAYGTATFISDGANWMAFPPA
jgi:hypothetical protein